MQRLFVWHVVQRMEMVQPVGDNGTWLERSRESTCHERRDVSRFAPAEI